MKAPKTTTSPLKALAKKLTAPRPTKPAAVTSHAREWLAEVPAFAKAKPGESDLPEYKKKAIPEGTRLTATLSEETDTYWRIKDGKIDGKSLPRNIRIIEKAEWTLLPLPGDHEPAAAASPSAAEHLAEPPPVAAPAKLTICVRGIRPIAPHLKSHFNLVEEGWSSHKKWAILPVARAVALYEEAKSPAGRALLEKLPAMPPDRFVSDLNTAASDVYVLFFAWEASSLLYRSKSTGMVLPLKYELIGNVGFDTVGYPKIAGRAAAAGLTEADWVFLQEEFEFVGPLDESQLSADVRTIFAGLAEKIVIVVMLNTKVGQAPWLLKLHERINAVVRPLAEAHNVETIDINEFVQSPDDLAQPKNNGGAFKPRVFRQLAERVTEIIAMRQSAPAAPAG